MAARQRELKILKKQNKEILTIYKNAAASLEKKAASFKIDTLSERAATDLKKEVRKELNKLQARLYKSNVEGIKAAALAGNSAQVNFFKQAGKKYGLDIDKGFSSVFSRVQKDVIDEIVSGGFYRDNKGLSKRIWWDVKKMDDDIQHMLNQAIVEKKGAVDFAKDLEKYVNPGAEKDIAWNKIYGGTSKKQIEYNSLRLARTSINHSYFESNRRSTEKNPYATGMLWELSGAHYERQIKPFGRDECDDFAEQDDYNLGTGVWPADKIPVPHPNCLCHQSAVIEKSLEEVGKELREWLDGAENDRLDTWYGKYGNEFAGAPKAAAKKAAKKATQKAKTEPRKPAKTPEAIKREAIQATNQQKLDEFSGIYARYDGKGSSDDILKFTKEIIDVEDMDFPVRMENISSNGLCSLGTEKSGNGFKEIKMQYMKLNSNEARPAAYRYKTAMHEMFHAKAGVGVKADFNVLRSFNQYAYYDDVFAETTSHYIAKQIGIGDNMATAYPRHLAHVLPKLKRLPEFSHVEDLYDVGATAFDYRFGSKVKGEWGALKLQLDEIMLDEGYYKQYNNYIMNNREEIAELFIEAQPHAAPWKSHMLNEIEAAVFEINNGSTIANLGNLPGNEQIIYSHAVVTAMKKVGIK